MIPLCKRPLRWLPRRVLLLTLALAASLPINGRLLGQELPEMLEVLDGPISLALKNGNQQTGKVRAWDGTTMRLEVSIGGGSAEFIFKRDEIKAIAFPGRTFINTLYQWTQIPERSEQAMQLFRAYYEQRGRFFDLMEEQDLVLFLRYANFALEQEEPIRAVAMIDRIRPHIENPALIAEIEENLLLALFNAGMTEEAEAKANEWIRAADPAGPSALGWRLLAELSFKQEDYETAFWTALHPVAFSNQMPMEHLNACYAFAITAASELRLKEPRQQLILEMRDRALPWPTNIAVLSGQAPALPTATADTEPADASPDDEAIADEPPIQTPSPVDPVESLPTRLLL